MSRSSKSIYQNKASAAERTWRCRLTRSESGAARLYGLPFASDGKAQYFFPTAHQSGARLTFLGQTFQITDLGGKQPLTEDSYLDV